MKTETKEMRRGDIGGRRMRDREEGRFSSDDLKLTSYDQDNMTMKDRK